MENKVIGLKAPKVFVADKSSDGKRANIIVSIFNPNRKQEVLTTFSGCDVLPGGRFRKDVSKRNIGVEYLIF